MGTRFDVKHRSSSCSTQLGSTASISARVRALLLPGSASDAGANRLELIPRYAVRRLPASGVGGGGKFESSSTARSNAAGCSVTDGTRRPLFGSQSSRLPDSSWNSTVQPASDRSRARSRAASIGARRRTDVSSSVAMRTSVSLRAPGDPSQRSRANLRASSIDLRIWTGSICTLSIRWTAVSRKGGGPKTGRMAGTRHRMVPPAGNRTCARGLGN